MDCYIFDTEAEAQEAQALDYIEWKATDPTSPHWAITTAWAPIQQDGTRWYYPICPHAALRGRIIEAVSPIQQVTPMDT